MAERWEPQVRNALTVEQWNTVAWLLESAAMAVGLREWEDQQDAAPGHDVALAAGEERSGGD